MTLTKSKYALTSDGKIGVEIKHFGDDKYHLLDECRLQDGKVHRSISKVVTDKPDDLISMVAIKIYALRPYAIHKL